MKGLRSKKQKACFVRAFLVSCCEPALFIVRSLQKNLADARATPPPPPGNERGPGRGDLSEYREDGAKETHALLIKEHAFHGPLSVLRLLKAYPESFSFGKGL